MTPRSRSLWVVAGSLALGVLVGWHEVTAVGAFVALVLLVLSFAFPAEAVVTIVVIAILQYLPTKAFNLLPQTAVLVDDVMTAGVAARLVADMAMSRVRPPRWLVAPLAGFLVVALSSALINRAELGVTVNALRSLLLPVILMPAAAVYLTRETQRRNALRVIMVLGMVNAGISIIQWISRPSSPDVATGVLGPGGANGSGFLSLVVLILALVSAWPMRSRLLSVTALGAGLLVSSARAAIVAAPAAVLIAGWRSVGLTRAKRVTSILLVVALTFGLAHYYRVAGRSLGEEISPAELLTSQSVAEQGGRLLYLRSVPAVWRQHDLSVIWGVGGGGYTSFVGMNRLAPDFVAQARVRTDSITGYAYPDMQWTALLGEYGILGAVLAAIMLFLPTVRMRNFFSLPLERSDAVLVTSMPPILVVWIAGMSAVNIMEYAPVAAPLWVLTGAAAAAVTAYREDVV